MKYVRLKPGSVWYHGSEDCSPTHIPPCSFFAKHSESAGRFILQPGVKRYFVACSYIPARLVAAPTLLIVSRDERAVLEMFAGTYEQEKAEDFCARREEFPGVDGWYNDRAAGGILLFEPDRFMKYVRAVQFPAAKVRAWQAMVKGWDT